MQAEELKSERLLLMIEPSLIKVVDDYRYDNRIPSRAAAVRELMVKGLNAENEKAEAAVDAATPA